MNIKRLHSEFAKLLSYSDELIDKLPKLTLKKDVVIYLYFFSLFDILVDVTVLLEKSRLRNIPVLMRVFIETYVDLKLIILDSKYINSLIYKADSEEIKKIDAVLNEDFSSNLAERKKELQDNLKKIKPLIKENNIQSIKHKFDILGFEFEYKILYNDLCSHSHNVIRQIEEKHMSLFENGEKIYLNHQVAASLQDYKHYFISIYSYFVDVIYILNEVYNLKGQDLIEKINELRIEE